MAALVNRMRLFGAMDDCSTTQSAIRLAQLFCSLRDLVPAFCSWNHDRVGHRLRFQRPTRQRQGSAANRVSRLHLVAAWISNNFGLWAGHRMGWLSGLGKNTDCFSVARQANLTTASHPQLTIMKSPLGSFSACMAGTFGPRRQCMRFSRWIRLHGHPAENRSTCSIRNHRAGP